MLSLDSILRAWEVTYQSVQGAEDELQSLRDQLTAMILEKNTLLKRCTDAEQHLEDLKAEQDALLAESTKNVAPLQLDVLGTPRMPLASQPRASTPLVSRFRLGEPAPAPSTGLTSCVRMSVS